MVNTHIEKGVNKMLENKMVIDSYWIDYPEQTEEEYNAWLEHLDEEYERNNNY